MIPDFSRSIGATRPKAWGMVGFLPFGIFGIFLSRNMPTEPVRLPP